MSDDEKMPGTWFGPKGYPVRGTFLKPEYYSCTIKELRANSYPIDMFSAPSVLLMIGGAGGWMFFNIQRKKPFYSSVHRLGFLMAGGYFVGYYIKRFMQQYTMGKLKYSLDYAQKYGAKEISTNTEPITFAHPSVLKPWKPVR